MNRFSALLLEQYYYHCISYASEPTIERRVRLSQIIDAERTLLEERLR